MIEAGAPSLPDLWNRAVLALTDASSEKLGHVLQELIQVNLPLVVKYREVDVLSVLRDNASQQGLNAIATAFNILEKYGRNLLSPNKPKFWRAVKFNNPVFKSTVDAVKGGRDILRLYGYTVELRDGMSFPENVADPDPRRVAAVTVEVALLQVELDLLRKGMHPHPELFSQLLSTDTQVQQATPLIPSPPVQDLHPKADCAVTPTWTIGSPPSSSGVPSGGVPWTPLQEEGAAKGGGLPIPASPGTSCAVCSAELVNSHCRDCGLLFCRDCGDLYHRHPARAQHQRSPILPRVAAPGASHREVQNGEVVSLGKEPEIRATPNQTLTWSCPGCQLSNPGQGLVCRGCQLPRASREPPPPSRAAWSCQACTCLNEASSVLCSACDRPRLAGRPSFTPRPPASSIAPAPAPNLDPSPTPQAGKRDPASGWECRHCTYINLNRGRICEVCDRTSDPREGEGEGVPCGPVTTARPGQDAVSAELDRQRAMREDGLRLITAIRIAEEQQVSPEEVVCALRCAGDVPPLSWLETGLTQALESISELALQQGGPEVGLVGREEAHQAWLSCGGSVEEAALRCAQERRRKVGELEALGFRDRDEVLQTLYMNGGDVDRALVDLQRRLLQPFHNRIWQEHQEPIQLQLPDKERVLRKILATYSLQSWGRAEIVLSLMLEGNQHYQLSDVVEAVKESADREFIKRCLSLLCPICFSLYPRSKVQSLTSCECTVCLSCFKEYFTYTVRERNIKNLVCPICSKPDIDDEAQRLSYFSTLDVQLRDCLDTDDYNLFHKKLTERTLMMDPKFKWCTHCSNGFIYDGNQKQVTCPQCQGSFCVECKRPWEPQHQGISCEEFQSWKRENDPEYQAQGLAAYLKENGIDCPKCKFRYALARGGCMHFTCSQCQHEFCSGCYNAFLGKKKCNDPACRLKDSLHAHHPRDCLSYLRDWPVTALQELLQKHGVNFDTVPPAGAEATPGGNCRVMEQREDHGKLIDEACGKEACQGHAGLCESHYKEYLVSRINGHSLDPAHLYTVEEMEVFLNRMGKQQAPQAASETEVQYKARLLNVITAIPLGDKVPRIRK